MVCKYIRAGWLTYKWSLEFRLEIITDLLYSIISLLILIYLWNSVGYRFSVEYFCVITLMEFFVVGNFVLRLIDEHIRKGSLTGILLKPQRIDLFYFFTNFIPRIGNNLLKAMIIIFISGFLGVDVKKLVLLLFLFPIFYALSFYFFYLFSIISFKTESSWGFFLTFRFIFIDFFGGRFIPLDVLRKTLGNWIDYLPFKYMLGAAFEIYKGNLSVIFIQIFWIVILYFLSNIAWKKMLRNYQGYGI